MPHQPFTAGAHHLSPSRAVALIEVWDAAHAFLPAVRRAELRLLPGAPAGAGPGDVAVEWVVPGVPFPRTFKAAAYRKAWLETVPLRLGELDAILHGSPVGDHTTGHLSVYRQGMSALFRAYEPPAVDEFGHTVGAFTVPAIVPPLTVGLVSAAHPDAILVTEQGVWHTLLPESLSLVAFGANLGVYLAHLPPPGTALTPDECREAMAHYWIGVVSALSARAAQVCRCGRDIADHKPSWATTRAAAAASGRPLTEAAGQTDPSAVASR
ncbi:hypothetical protein [Streptomyces sp. SID3343]|uniref:hypothetical protein n=1 Tax=Streptomyces sp. SID3343 TaxID=2690260 RepID=UPI00136A8414|nr:hypothetical protein [Streptomyces sp. SID3343]MYW03196.1 hypothetical protein [Streptomyces sp. SID3343]